VETANEKANQEQQALLTRLSQQREKLDGLVGALHGIDRELEGLSRERRQHELLLQVCGGLEELDALGGAALFWGEQADPAQTQNQLRAVRARMEGFAKHLGEIEERRQAVLEEIEQAQVLSEFLEDDLFEARAREEQRKQEWIIEREVESFPVRSSLMPWTRGGEDDRRFRKALLAALLLSLLLGLVFPMIDIPLPDQWEAVEVPERFTRLIEMERQPPPPPVQETKPEEQQKLAEESSETKTEKKKVDKKPVEAKKGILAFREKFSGLASNVPDARLGAQARIRKSGAAASGRPTRSLVSTQAPGSGGIDIGSLSRDVGGGGDDIEGVEIARATSAIGSIAGTERPLSDGPGPARTDEEIQIVFDRHKAALYRLYNRELRRDPTLRGQMVLRIRIEPDGSVTLCELQSSDMQAPDLSAQVVARVKAFDFGAKDGVSAITILYPIDFLPAT